MLIEDIKICGKQVTLKLIFEDEDTAGSFTLNMCAKKAIQDTCGEEQTL